jgi:hypothetical protein
MSKSDLLEDALETLRQQGVTAEVEQGLHFKVRFINALGSSCCLIVSRTPSDRLSLQNNRSVLRRLLRRDPK